MLFIRRGCGIHALGSGAGGAGVFDVRFCVFGVGAQQQADRGYTRFRARATPTGHIRLNGIPSHHRGRLPTEGSHLRQRETRWLGRRPGIGAVLASSGRLPLAARTGYWDL